MGDVGIHHRWSGQKIGYGVKIKKEQGKEISSSESPKNVKHWLMWKCYKDVGSKQASIRCTNIPPPSHVCYGFQLPPLPNACTVPVGLDRGKIQILIMLMWVFKYTWLCVMWSTESINPYVLFIIYPTYIYSIQTDVTVSPS